MEINMEVPQKTKNRPYNSAIPFLDIYPKEYKSSHNRDTYTAMFVAAVFTIA
jgi:hypothetical protein